LILTCILLFSQGHATEDVSIGDLTEAEKDQVLRMFLQPMSREIRHLESGIKDTQDHIVRVQEGIDLLHSLDNELSPDHPSIPAADTTFHLQARQQSVVLLDLKAQLTEMEERLLEKQQEYDNRSKALINSL